MIRVASIIFSYNDPVRVLRCYGELLRTRTENHRIFVLDNSRPGLGAKTPDTIWLGEDNVGHGGMIDFVVGWADAEHYDFVGMLNCDTWGYRKDFMQRMLPYMDDTIGMISPAIAQGSCWPCMSPAGKPPGARFSNFVETIAPYYNWRLLEAMQPLCPFEKYGYVDRALSVFSIRHGFRNRIVDATSIQHDAGAGMADDARAELQAKWRASLLAWCDGRQSIQDTPDLWPDEINAMELPR